MGLWRHRLEFGSIAFWAVLIGLSLIHNLSMLDDQAREVAVARARMVFSIVETTRLWNAEHGGLYAPVDEDTPPNPYLVDDRRDVTIDGQLYTKINPAYMTRQISELVAQQKGISFRITSQKPIRPENAPDEWELGALKRFETGEVEVLDQVAVGSERAFRYMAMLKVREECMQCHASQGYALGDIRGGMSVTIPGAQVFGEIVPQRRQAMILHLAGFILLAGGSLFLVHRQRESWRALAAAKAEQERMVAERTAELRAANADLARSNAELENFAYIASHDLQEPLRMMGTYAQLIDRRYSDRLDQDGREFLGFMTDGAARMKAMIDDLLAYSRVDRGTPDPQPVDLGLAVDAARANLAAAISESGAEIQCLGQLPMVLGELPLLERLLQNLIGNALKYRRPDVPPRITIAAEPYAGGWQVAVTDNGIGIPADSRERIFLIFQRLHPRSEYPGTGIGLAVCRKIVERRGGAIWADAAEGGGSVFHFTLPAVTPETDVAAAEQDLACN